MNRRDVLIGMAATLCLPLTPADAFPVMRFADGRHFERVAAADVLNPARCLLEPRWPAPREAWQEAAACGRASFFSLMGDKPELTLYVAGDTVQLVTPPPRTRLDARFAPHLRAFLERTGLHFSRAYAESGVIEAGGRYWDVFNLPEGMAVEGNLNLSHMPVAALPDGLTVEGSLDVSHTGLTRLPERLKVGGDLAVSGTPIAALPRSAEVGGVIYGLPGRPVWFDADARQPFERPAFLAPKNLSACEQLHLGGEWTTENLTAGERDAALKQLRAELANVRKACASGRGDYLL